MHIKIMSRERLEMVSRFPFPPRTAVISITDTASALTRIENSPEHLLRLSFNDIDPWELFSTSAPSKIDDPALIKKYGLFTKSHADKVAHFYSTIRNSTELLICQCEYGQSRSAAIAAAISEHRTRKGIDIFSDARFFPNKHVFHLTLAALKNLSASQETADMNGNKYE